MTPAEVLEARDALADMLYQEHPYSVAHLEEARSVAETIIRAGWTPPEKATVPTVDSSRLQRKINHVKEVVTDGFLSEFERVAKIRKILQEDK